MSVLSLARPDIVALKAYEHARWLPELERLHANELPWRTPTDASNAGLNRYPEPQPHALIERLAKLYGVRADQVLVGRGSDEGIDLLTRAFCRPAIDAIVICPPTFGMYAVAAQIQGARVLEVPLDRARGFALDAEGICAALPDSVKLVYVCSPNNPTGNSLAKESIERVLDAAAGRALVVIDEAYAEFAAGPSWAGNLASYPHLVVLRTLSKAHGLAGARVGTVLAAPEIIALLRKIIPPYAMPQLTIEAALEALEPAPTAVAAARIRQLLDGRAALKKALANCDGVTRVWPSDANFLLVEFADTERALAAIQAAKLIVRDVRRQRGLERALRITVGTAEQNARLIAGLA